MTSDPDIHACPFCGKPAAIIRWDPSHPMISHGHGVTPDQHFSVACVNPDCPCRPSTKISPKMGEVIALWEQRFTPDMG